jgi:hypothetical protein
LLFRSELIPTIQKKNSANTIKVDLANEKLSRLIEILKAIARGQGELIKDQEEIKQALADLRRKANINISRNDDIKKALR